MAHVYNEQPDFWREITGEKFALKFFQYIFKEPESRQMFYNTKDEKLKESLTRVKLFEIAYEGWEGLGVAIAWTKKGIAFFQWLNPRKKPKFLDKKARHRIAKILYPKGLREFF